MAKHSDNSVLQIEWRVKPVPQQCFSQLHKFRKDIAFTLAEVLITLGIIGVVAAMTIPSLISSFQKKIYYSKFMKARMVIENALKLYINDGGCASGITLDRHSCFDEFPKYFNVSTFITEDNYQEVCKNYNKVAYNYDGTNTISAIPDICENISCNKNGAYAIITKDGTFFNFCSEVSNGIVDTNGPNNGPNIFGRDLFAFKLTEQLKGENEFCGNMWGITEVCYNKMNPPYENSCHGDNKEGYYCGARLIEEGKMNY